MVDIWSVALGGVIAAVAALGGQYFSFRQQRFDSNEKLRGEVRERKRQAVHDLLAVVARDVTSFKGKLREALDDAHDQELANVMGATVRDVAEARDAARGVAARVGDKDIRDKAMDVYMKYEEWLDARIDSLVNQSPERIGIQDAATRATATFYEAVEDYLTELDNSK